MADSAAPQMLAKMTFLPRPMTKRCMPCEKPSGVVSRRPIWAAMSEYCTMGPAISWGKQLTYSSSREKYFCARVLRRYTSTV